MPKEKTRPHLVIDTNVFVSGLISGTGSPARVLRAIQNKKAIHLVSDPIVEEYLRVLEYPRIRTFRRVTDAFIAEVAAYLLYQTERVELISTIKLSPDPDDDVFLETAVDGKATLLVTGDKIDLLSLLFIQGIPIVSAKDALIRLEL
ncbi:MAG TPA: putative toxin-antitoxin system toxin component, PIN family [Candidatus Sulfotelmatobacter sp.]